MKFRGGGGIANLGTMAVVYGSTILQIAFHPRGIDWVVSIFLNFTLPLYPTNQTLIAQLITWTSNRYITDNWGVCYISIWYHHSIRFEGMKPTCDSWQHVISTEHDWLFAVTWLQPNQPIAFCNIRTGPSLAHTRMFTALHIKVQTITADIYF